MRMEYDITRYSIELVSSVDAAAAEPTAAARVLLFERRKFRAWLLFYPGATPLPSAHLVDGKHLALFYPMDQFTAITALLREEERLKVVYETDPANSATGTAWIATGGQYIPRGAEEHLEDIAPGLPGRSFDPRD